MNQAFPPAESALPAAPHFADRWCSSYAILIASVGAVTAWLFFPFTVDDAFITARYAENLVDTGELVFNTGERVSALTSPLHALVEAGLYALTRQTHFSYKILAGLAYLGSLSLVVYRYREEPTLSTLSLLFLVAPPCLIEWTFGGLETPLLMFLITLATVLAWTPEKISGGRLCAIALLAGCAFVTRYDSVIYLLPFSFFAAWKCRNWKWIPLGVLCGASLPTAWLGFSHWYYGEILPTSAYLKAPILGFYFLKLNATYVLEYLFQLGFIPCGFWLLWLAPAKRQFLPDIRQHAKTNWGVALGLAAMLGYGVLIATTHMMFAFRFFVPYLPALTLLLVEFIRQQQTRYTEPRQQQRFRWSYRVLVPVLLSYSVVQVAYTYCYSVDGLVYPIGDRIVGEYKAESLEHYSQNFVPLLEKQAHEIERHWQRLPLSDQRPLRLHTYVGGVPPYWLKQAYIYEQLISYRATEKYNTRVSADYIQLLLPSQGKLEDLLPGPDDQYLLISSYRMPFENTEQIFCVYYNPHPEPNRLPARTDGQGQPVGNGERIVRSEQP